MSKPRDFNPDIANGLLKWAEERGLDMLDRQEVLAYNRGFKDGRERERAAAAGLVEALISIMAGEEPRAFHIAIEAIKVYEAAIKD